MEILDLAKLFLKSFKRVIILRCGVSSGIIQMFCHIGDDVGYYGRVILLPFIFICGTMWYVSELW